MSKLIEYKGVEVHQADQIVLHDVNLTVEEGEMIYLLGKVGSGKSSFMKTLYGALPIASGEAHVLGYDMRTIRRRKLPYLRRRLGIIFQDYKLLTDRSVEENLLFVLRATGWKDKNLMRDHVHEVLQQVGMETKAYKKPYELSGGEQQRVVIARALLNSPEIILADEPTGNLDAETGREIMELLYSISKAGITVLMSTHSPARYGCLKTERYVMSINEAQDAIIEEFEAFDDWIDRYQLLSDYGRELKQNPLPEEDRIDRNLIDGCQSKVWITCRKGEDGKLYFKGDSDALLVQGIVALILQVFNGHTPKEILDTQLYFIERIGLQEHLSPTRSNGVVAMIKQIRMFALAYQAV